MSFLYQTKNQKAADRLIEDINWDNWEMEEDEDFPDAIAYFPIESILYNNCEWAAIEGKDLLEDELEEIESFKERVILYAQAMGDTELESYMRETEDEDIAWAMLAEYFSQLAANNPNADSAIEPMPFKNHYTELDVLMIVGASRSGKTTIANGMTEALGELFVKSVSMTTRPPRAGEVHGTDYFFVSSPAGTHPFKEEAFLEIEKFGEHYYGTPLVNLKEAAEARKTLVMVVEPKGAANIYNNIDTITMNDSNTTIKLNKKIVMLDIPLQEITAKLDEQLLNDEISPAQHRKEIERLKREDFNDEVIRLGLLDKASIIRTGYYQNDIFSDIFNMYLDKMNDSQRMTALFGFPSGFDPHSLAEDENLYAIDVALREKMADDPRTPPLCSSFFGKR